MSGLQRFGECGLPGFVHEGPVCEPGRCKHGPHNSDGRFVYSDGSGHACCRACVHELSRLDHGPGCLKIRIIPKEAEP